MWHDAIEGQEIRSYCPTCEAPKKRTAFDDLPQQRLKKGTGVLRTVESKARLPKTEAVGAMRVVLAEGAVYCYISADAGWVAVGTPEQAAEAIEGPERKIVKAKDKKNNRRAAIEATKRKQAERERASRSNQTKESKT
jgi:hypothetical protein